MSYILVVLVLTAAAITNADKTVEESIDNKDVVVGGDGIGDDDIIEWSKMVLLIWHCR